MLYLLAVIGALTIAIVFWRAFGAERIQVAPRGRALAPDDDPEFLRKLGEQRKDPGQGPVNPQK